MQSLSESENAELEVNHIDGNKLNNHYSNLEWCTSSENKQHAFRVGLRAHRSAPSEERGGDRHRHRRQMGLVSAAEDRMAASGIVDALLTWVEEPRTRDVLFTLTDRQYIIGGDPNERLPVLFEASVAAAEEITEALGAQVRRAVELLIQSFSESAAEAKRLGQPDPLPARRTTRTRQPSL